MVKITDVWDEHGANCASGLKASISIHYHSDTLNKNPAHASAQHSSHETDCTSYWGQHRLLHSTIVQGLLELRVQKVSILWCGNSCIWINYDQLWHTVYSQLSFVMPQVSDTHCRQSCGAVSDGRLLPPVKDVKSFHMSRNHHWSSSLTNSSVAQLKRSPSTEVCATSYTLGQILEKKGLWVQHRYAGHCLR